MDLGGTNRVQELPDNDTEWEAAVAVKLMCSGCMWRGTGMANGFFSFTCAFFMFFRQGTCLFVEEQKVLQRCKGPHLLSSTTS
ncbi:Os06g0231200 [Oryza sativa Japonica Group]|jgi:hypothetical protein|uniref:Os06g0231200 protein n=1 Tax=Oryza sativa subsp. japonica TaxID=39947 RepID=A0A0P0WUB5_ORYSJ|nr:Os06g0231200 [Oryza sativa Japonica Group]